MEEKLISKKELLSLTGISYGQLYRWKRKNIIPEEWFIKKSVPSGQETFFPREKILDRIDMIVNMKDETSLDDMAKMFSAEIEEESMDIEKLIRNKVISEAAIQLYKTATGIVQVSDFKQIVSAKLLNDQVVSGNITLEEGKNLVRFIETHFVRLTSEPSRVYLFRNMGLPFVIGVEDREKLVVDGAYKKIIEVNLYEEISTIKFELMR